MFSFKSAAAFSIAVLVLVPTLVRAHQKLEPPATAKPTASFRDVDRPSELNFAPPPEHRAAVFAVVPVFEAIHRVLPDHPCPLEAARGSRADVLRAPPVFV